MGLWGTLDTAVGGVLPGGPAPGEVRYRDTLLGKSTGAAATVLAAPTILIGQTVDGALGNGYDYGAAFRGAYSLGSAGSRPPTYRGYTAGDAALGTADTFSPDYFYTAPGPTVARQPGTQYGYSPIVDDVVDAAKKAKDALEEPFKFGAIALLAIGAFALAGRGRR